jgi:hypothetical protein
VPALIETIQRDHTGPAFGGWNVNAIWALGEFETDAGPAIPAIRLHLQDPDPMCRQACLRSLWKILPPDQAKTLVPDLLNNRYDRDPNLRNVARELLQKIDPTRAIRAEVQP